MEKKPQGSRIYEWQGNRFVAENLENMFLLHYDRSNIARKDGFYG